jgi:hypothetical protein
MPDTDKSISASQQDVALPNVGSRLRLGFVRTPCISVPSLVVFPRYTYKRIQTFDDRLVVVCLYADSARCYMGLGSWVFEVGGGVS